MKIPLIDKAISVISFLNGTGAGRGGISYQGIPGADIAAVRQVSVR